MYYASEMPKVVGEFDAVDLHLRIDALEAEHPGLGSYSVLKALAGDVKYPGIDNAVNVKYARFFNPAAFENYHSDGQVDDLFVINAGSRDTSVDNWHPDTSGNRFLVLPEILTTASIWPTEFLIGKVAINPFMQAQKRVFWYAYWETNFGKAAITTALESGDAYIHKFEPGEVLKVPKGTLHRRNIPENGQGHRYFMRRFPRFDLFRAGTNLGRMRPF